MVEINTRVHYASMFIICIGLAIAMCFAGCNDNDGNIGIRVNDADTLGTEINVDYGEFIKQEVEYSYVSSKYVLTTTSSYGNRLIYHEKDYFKTGEELVEIKLKRFKEAKIIVDNLVKYNQQ